MKMRIAGLLFVLLLTCGFSHAQAPAAASGGISYQAGVGATLTIPDYGTKVLTGITVYGDVDLAHLGIEFNWHDTDLGTPEDRGEASYVGGVRWRFSPIHRFRPYVKVMVGLGTFTYYYPFYGTSTSYTFKIADFGGGVEYPLPHHLNWRVFDAEYQIWPHFGSDGLSPVVMTTGVAYRF